MWSKPLAPGVPPIRLTSLERLKDGLQNAKKAVEEDKPDTLAEEKQPDLSTPVPHAIKSAPATPVTSSDTLQGRRFHLARHISSILAPNAAGGIRKLRSSIRPPLATFVERYAVTSRGLIPGTHDNPIDRLLDVPSNGAALNAEVIEGQEQNLDTLQASQRVPTNTFVQAQPKKVRNGTSIRDDPSTWDLESDQLADELAALAMEFDPDLEQKIEAERLAAPPPAPQDKVKPVDHWEDDYVYETYVRLPYSGEKDMDIEAQTNFGILVIDEDVEDLWQKYVDSEDDSDWDEEDSNGKFCSLSLLLALTRSSRG